MPSLLLPVVFLSHQIDRLFDWRRMPTSSVKEAVKKQKINTKDEFEDRVRGIVTEFAEQVKRSPGVLFIISSFITSSPTSCR